MASRRYHGLPPLALDPLHRRLTDHDTSVMTVETPGCPGGDTVQVQLRAANSVTDTEYSVQHNIWAPHGTPPPHTGYWQGPEADSLDDTTPGVDIFISSPKLEQNKQMEQYLRCHPCCCLNCTRRAQRRANGASRREPHFRRLSYRSALVQKPITEIFFWCRSELKIHTKITQPETLQHGVRIQVRIEDKVQWIPPRR
jgi:hypothetical protein